MRADADAGQYVNTNYHRVLQPSGLENFPVYFPNLHPRRPHFEAEVFPSFRDYIKPTPLEDLHHSNSYARWCSSGILVYTLTRYFQGDTA